MFSQDGSATQLRPTHGSFYTPASKGFALEILAWLDLVDLVRTFQQQHVMFVLDSLGMTHQAQNKSLFLSKRNVSAKLR